MIVYHGGKQEIKKPRILVNGFNKDFGYGFYCSEIEKQAKKWAMTKSLTHPIVSVFQVEINGDLNIKKFDTMTDEWLEFIARCRVGETHSFDIVEGPMADDTVWDYVNDFIAGRISKELFFEFAKFKYPTHQITFCTERALQCLKFERSFIANDQ